MKHILRLTGSISLASSFFPYLQGEKWDRSSSSIWGDCNYIFGSVQDCFLSCINTSEVCALWPFFQKHQLVLIKGTSYPISEGMICLNFRYSKFEGKLLSSLIFTLIHNEYVILPQVFHFTAGENLCGAPSADMEDETSQEISLCFVLIGVCGNLVDISVALIFLSIIFNEFVWFWCSILVTVWWLAVDGLMADWLMFSAR